MNLTGKKEINKMNLSGKILDIQTIPNEINNLKKKIMNDIIIPIVSKQWNILYENLFLLDYFNKKVNKYYEKYNLSELLVYKDLLVILHSLVEEHMQLEDLENKMYKNKDSSNIGNEDLSQVIYKTTMIRLKPEFELYDNIIGKPKREKNELYNEIIIKDIQDLMKNDNINFNKIKEIITTKYFKKLYF